MNRLRGLYVILDEDAYGDQLLLAAAEFFHVGVRIVQYRAKNGINLSTLRLLSGLCDRWGVLLIINDDLDAARYADGVHLGQEDLAGRDIAQLREMLPGKILGISCHTLAQADAAAGADYLGVGPYRATSSKNVAREPLGLAGVKQIVDRVNSPVCAIGGIEAEDIAPLREIGVAMAAVIGGLAKAQNRVLAAQLYLASFEN